MLHNFSDRMKEARHRLRIKQEEIAQLLGISRNYVSLLETGARPPTTAVIDSFEANIEPKLKILKQNATPENIDVHKEDNLINSLLYAHEALMSNPNGAQISGWISSAMVEASEALRFKREGDLKEACARAYKAQRIFGRIFRTAFDEQ